MAILLTSMLGTGLFGLYAVFRSLSVITSNSWHLGVSLSKLGASGGSFAGVLVLFALATVAWVAMLTTVVLHQGVVLWVLPAGAFVVELVIGARILWRVGRDWFFRGNWYDTVQTEETVTMESPEELALGLRLSVAEVAEQLPDWIPLLERMVAWEEAHPYKDDWEGFTWHQIPTSPGTLNQMVVRGLVAVIYHSRAYTHYRLVDRPTIAEALEMLRSDLRVLPDSLETANLFGDVIGHDNAKMILRNALTADRAVHCLLVGPPGTAKTLMLSDVGRLPGAELYAGSTTTKAGLVGLLLTKKPRYLVIDELDKMDRADMTPLLNLMEGGVVTLLQHRVDARQVLDTRVFAGANDLSKIPAPNLSRFARIEVPGYSKDEFMRVAEALLTKREGLGPQSAHLVAVEVVRFSTDIRDAVRVARLAKGQMVQIRGIVRALFTNGRADLNVVGEDNG